MSEQAKHTPGPWRFIDMQSESRYARNYGVQMGLDGGFTLPPIPAAKANASLISAAPELLDALMMFVWPYQEGDSHTEAERRDIATKAITKALGGTE